ncbi:MAG: hypothetical protein R2844_07550 [Caldilineales bacterium]
MRNFVHDRSQSLAMVVLVLLAILLVQGEISYTTTYGALGGFIPSLDDSILPAAGLGLRVVLAVVLVVLWLLKAKRTLFKTIIVVNALLMLGLLMNLSALMRCCLS